MDFREGLGCDVGARKGSLSDMDVRNDLRRDMGARGDESGMLTIVS